MPSLIFLYFSINYKFTPPCSWEDEAGPDTDRSVSVWEERQRASGDGGSVWMKEDNTPEDGRLEDWAESFE